MNLLLCLTMGLLYLLATDAKGIQIQIESDDILKLLNGVMSSQTVKNFAQQIVQRSFSKRVGYNNPYHPEDDLVNTFDATVDKERTNIQMNPKYNVDRPAGDTLDQDNDNFILGNDVISDDALTDVDSPSKPTKEDTLNVNDNEHYPEEKKIDAAVTEKAITIKDTLHEYKDDRFNYKPVQKRFQLKSSNDTQI